MADPGFPRVGGANFKGGCEKLLLPSANEVCEGYVFTGVCLSTGGHAWRGVCGRGVCMAGGYTWQGACMVGGHVWQGGMHGRGSVHSGGHVGWGLHAMYAPWQILRDTVIWSMSGQYASFWYAFLFSHFFSQKQHEMCFFST